MQKNCKNRDLSHKMAKISHNKVLFNKLRLKIFRNSSNFFTFSYIETNIIQDYYRPQLQDEKIKNVPVPILIENRKSNICNL